MQKQPEITMAQIRGYVGRDDPVVLEFGANDGRDTNRFLEEFPGIRLFAFEPDRRCIEAFGRHVDDPRCELITKAVGCHDGKATFYASSGTPPAKFGYDGPPTDDWRDSGSLHPPTGHLHMSPWTTFPDDAAHRYEVDVITLDTWFAEHPEIGTIDFLWMDTQGAEGDIIRGGLVALRRTRFVYTEHYATPQYEGQPPTNELIGLMRAVGFVPVSRHEGDNMLFRRTE